jgi:hypothetical protein
MKVQLKVDERINKWIAIENSNLILDSKLSFNAIIAAKQRV